MLRMYNYLFHNLLIVLAMLMVMLLLINVGYVMMIHQTIVLRIVLVIGEAL